MLQKTIKKSSPYKRAYIRFASRWKHVMSPTKKAILHEVKKGSSPQHAVDVVFAKYGIRRKFEKFLMDAVMTAVKTSGVRFK